MTKKGKTKRNKLLFVAYLLKTKKRGRERDLKMGEVNNGERIVIPESFQGPGFEIMSQMGLMWELIKAPLIVPVLRFAVYVCLAMSLMLLMERLYMGIVIVLVKLFWKKPEKRYKYEQIQDDVEFGTSNFPVVLIQIPMFNEREVNSKYNTRIPDSFSFF